MHLDDGAVQRQRFELDAHDLFSLQLFEDPVEDAVLRPAVHAHVDGVPIAEATGQAAPFAAMLRHVQDGVEHLQVRQADVAALHRKVRGNASVLGFRDLHPKMITRFA